MMPLTSKERVLTVLEHKKPDRVPIVIGASNATGIQMRAYQRLKAQLGISAPDRYLYDWPELGTADPDETTLQHLHSDVRGVHDSLPSKVYERNNRRQNHSPFIDDWGTG